MSSKKFVIHWFRRDLRTHDNHALHEALQSGFRVKPIFIFDDKILTALPQEDKRVHFIHNSVAELKRTFQQVGGDVQIYHGDPIRIWKQLGEDKNLEAVFTNRDYEPYATARDKEIYALLQEKGVSFKEFKDHVIFDKNEILSLQQTPYTVYTPYMKMWKKSLDPIHHLRDYEINLSTENTWQCKPQEMPSMAVLGFKSTTLPNIPQSLDSLEIEAYEKTRDLPFLDSTTRIGTALRFGNVSIRQAVKWALEENETFLNELIWRDFFSQVLYNFPKAAVQPFRPKYSEIPWLNNEEDFQKWCEGKTGFPIVDAGMRQLNETGFMHNRVRMITASFLVKDLLINYRWGEAYFAQKLMDYDLASNNGNWQWAAGTGCDAAPYFRVFNPTAQQEKFDPEFKYIKKWVPEFGTPSYPEPMVDHQMARERCIETYKKGLALFES